MAEKPERRKLPRRISFGCRPSLSRHSYVKKGSGEEINGELRLRAKVTRLHAPPLARRGSGEAIRISNFFKDRN